MPTAIEVPNKIHARLTELAEKTGRSPNEHVREALLEYLADQEDYRIAVQRLQRDGRRIPLEELERELGLDR